MPNRETGETPSRDICRTTSTTSAVEENRRGREIAEIHGHRNRVTAGLTQGRGENLDDPERERDGGHFAQNLVCHVTVLIGREPSQSAAARLIFSKNAPFDPLMSETSITVPGWASVSK